MRDGGWRVQSRVKQAQRDHKAPSYCQPPDTKRPGLAERLRGAMVRVPLKEPGPWRHTSSLLNREAQQGLIVCRDAGVADVVHGWNYAWGLLRDPALLGSRAYGRGLDRAKGFRCARKDAAGPILVTVLGMVAEMERRFIREWQQAGIEAAKDTRRNE